MCYALVYQSVLSDAYGKTQHRFLRFWWIPKGGFFCFTRPAGFAGRLINQKGEKPHQKSGEMHLPDLQPGAVLYRFGDVFGAYFRASRKVCDGA